MIVLQTLGAHNRTGQRGIFQYCRNANGVYFDCSIGFSDSEPFGLTHEEWFNILEEIESPVTDNTTFSLTQDLYPLLRDSLPRVGLNDSQLSCIAAVLHHEGTLELYHGPRGPYDSVSLVLAKG